jgi:hypothetical protein
MHLKSTGVFFHFRRFFERASKNIIFLCKKLVYFISIWPPTAEITKSHLFLKLKNVEFKISFEIFFNYPFDIFFKFV